MQDYLTLSQLIDILLYIPIQLIQSIIIALIILVIIEKIKDKI